MQTLGLLVMLAAVVLFLVKVSLMLVKPEAHFFLDRWLRGDKGARREFENPTSRDLQMRIAGVIFIAVSILFGKGILTALLSKVGTR